MVDKLKRMGLRATPQRVAVLAFLQGNASHPSAEQIFEALKPMMPSLSLATVYGTLEALVRGGEIQELAIDPERKHFDPDPRPHNHFLCRSCGRIYDFPGELPVLELAGEMAGFFVETCAVNLYGVCPACRRR